MISIPHWFYSNGKNYKKIMKAVRNFNTTLVLFKPKKRDYITIEKTEISIPHWFYSNKIKSLENQLERANFNTTLVLFKHCYEVKKVLDCKNISIPHWFYSNISKQLNRFDNSYIFQYHTGSIQTHT